MVGEIKPDSNVAIKETASGTVIVIMLMAGLLPGPLIKGHLHFVVFSSLWHFIMLHFRENWLRSLHMYKSKFTHAPPPRPGN